MFRNFRDRIALSGIAVLLIGVALLVFTFVSAYGFLTQSLSIIASQDLVQTFGEALAPLIASCIRIMYLGVMGWVGSLITIRGVTIIAHVPETSTVTPNAIENKQQARLDQKLKAQKPQKQTKPAEPEFIVIPPEEISQRQAEPKRSNKEENESAQQVTS